VGDIVARFCNDIVFDTAGRAYKEDLGSGVVGANRVRNSYGGVDVTARAAASENDFHFSVLSKNT
jgi:hypothetical protein